MGIFGELISFAIAMFLLFAVIFVCVKLSHVEQELKRANKLLDGIIKQAAGSGFILTSIDKNTGDVASFYRENDVKLER